MPSSAQPTKEPGRLVEARLRNVVIRAGASRHSTMAEERLSVLEGGMTVVYWLARSCVVALHVVRFHRVQLEENPVDCLIETKMAVRPPWCFSPWDVDRAGLRIVSGNRVHRNG